MSSRRCQEEEKIFIHDCENTMKEGEFERVCYCRYRLCNNGYSTHFGDRFRLHYGGAIGGQRLDTVLLLGLLLGWGVFTRVVLG